MTGTDRPCGMNGGEGGEALRNDMGLQGAALRQLAADTSLRQALSRVSSVLLTQQRVVFSGVGASLHAAEIIAARFRARGLMAWALNAAELVHHTPDLHGAPLVLISQSGGSIEVVKAARAHAGQAPTWCITLNPEASLPHVTPLVMPGGDERGYAATRSFTSTLAVGESLLELCLRGRAGAERVPDGAEWPTAVDWRSVADDVEQANAGLAGTAASAVGRLAGATALLFTGRGALAGVAAYGALITMELARRPAFSLESAMVRHGPLEAFGPELALVVLRQADAVAPLVSNLAALAQAYDSPTVLVHVGDPHDGPGDPEPVVAARARSPIAALLVQCVAMQHIAIGLSEARGLTPGEETRGSKVTRVE